MTEQMTYAAFQSRYREQHFIGSGGFARVFKVFDHAKNGYVALKMAHVNPDWKQFTLQREVELVNKLDEHRNIARYDSCYRFNTGIAGDMDFAILKFYESGNLEQFLKRVKLTLPEKHRVIKGVLRGIGFLHRNGVTHRDMKAQNILMSREDGVWTPKITDFGLAREFGGKHTMTNSSIGLTYAYAAPEQIQNQKHITKNVDLWAVGVIIYRILAGELPFGGGSVDNKSTQSQLELSRKILHLELPAQLGGLPEPYQQIIRRCLVLDPRARVQTAEELIELLEPEATLEDVTAPVIVPVNPPEERIVPEPVPDVPTQEGVETQVLIPEPQKVPIPTPVRTDPAPVAPPAPPLYEEAVSQVYEQPHHNPTQFNFRPAEPVVEPEPVAPSVPLVGGRRRSRWPWWLAALVVLGLVGGGWYFQDRIRERFASTTPRLTEPEPDDKEEQEFKTFGKPDPFHELTDQVERAKLDNERLAGLMPAIEAMMAEYPGDWKGAYLAAKNCFYRTEDTEGYEFFVTAVGLATSREDKNAFLALVEAESVPGNPRLAAAVAGQEAKAELEKLK